MPIISRTDQQLIFHPLDFALTVLRNFGKNQGLLLAGAIAFRLLKAPRVTAGGRGRARMLTSTSRA